MKVLVATDGNEQNDFFMTKFFTEGHKPIKALSEEEILNTLEEKEPEMLLLDYDSDRYDKIETIKKVKLANNNIIIIVLTYKSDFQFVKKANELGVFAIIPKIEDASKQFQEILISLNNLGKRKEEKRKYIRVTPDEKEKNNARMKIPGIQTIYHGIVKDISLGGALIEFKDLISDSLLYKGKLIIINIELEDLSLRAECIIVIKRGQAVGMRFKGLNDANISNLSKYILTRIE